MAHCRLATDEHRHRHLIHYFHIRRTSPSSTKPIQRNDDSVLIALAAGFLGLESPTLVYNIRKKEPGVVHIRLTPKGTNEIELMSFCKSTMKVSETKRETEQK